MIVFAFALAIIGAGGFVFIMGACFAAKRADAADEAMWLRSLERDALRDNPVHKSLYK